MRARAMASRRVRSGAYLITVLICVPLLSSCSSSDGDARIVASVNGVPISAASLKHWVRIESVISYRLYPTDPVPKGVIADPPNYLACVAWLGSPAGPVESRSLPAAQRKKYCERRLGLVKKKTLEFLILYQWYVGELKTQGVNIPESEVQRDLQRLIQAELPGKGKLRRYFAATGMTAADLLFIGRLTTYGEKINKQMQSKASVTQERRAFIEFTSKWTAKTNCRPGYVVPGCRQYHGPEGAP